MRSARFLLTLPAALLLMAGSLAAEPLRVGGNVAQENLITRTVPRYPPDAKRDRIQGLVRLEVRINTDGAVSDVKLISGDPALADAAIAAVTTWRYRPFLDAGQPVEVITTVDVNFTLAQ